jgi:hypothetical protein
MIVVTLIITKDSEKPPYSITTKYFRDSWVSWFFTMQGAKSANLIKVFFVFLCILRGYYFLLLLEAAL